MSTNVLFLDDETMVLQALRRSLKTTSIDWTMYFCASAEETWTMMETHSVDVVVTDMQMPGLNGDEFLTSLRRSWPTTSRLVLTGFKDKDLALRTVSAHRFLMKPIMSTMLIEQIHSVVEATPKDESLRRLTNGTIGVLATKQAVDEFRSALANPRARAVDVANVAQKDPSLAIAVLRLGNLPALGLRKIETNLEVCVQAIGLDSLRTVAMNDELFPTLSPGDDRYDALAAVVEHASDLAAREDDEVRRLGVLAHVVGTLLRLQPTSGTPTDLTCEHDADLSGSLLRLWGIPSSIADVAESMAGSCQHDTITV